MHDPDFPNRPRIQYYYGGLPIPGPGGIIALAVVYFILLLSVVAAISAIIAGPVLRVVGKLYDWDNPPGWGYAFSAAFLGFFAYFLVAVFLLDPDTVRMPKVVPLPFTVAWFWHALEVHGLPILACAATIWWWMHEDYDVFAGLFGFVRAILASVLCLWISTQMIAASAGRVVDGANETADGFVAGVLGLGMLTLIVAVVGGLFATLPVFAGTRLLARGDAPRPGLGRAFVTAVLVVATWLAVSLALEFCFNALDKPYFYFKDPAVAASVNVSPFLYLLPFALGFVLCQATAVGLAGGVVAARFKPRFAGRAGWIRASVVAFFAVAAAVVPFTLLIVAMIASGEFKELFQYF